MSTKLDRAYEAARRAATQGRSAPRRTITRTTRHGRISRRTFKFYPRNQGWQDATWSWARANLPREALSIRVIAWTDEYSAPDRGLAQDFTPDVQGQRAAISYAKQLLRSGRAISVSVLFQARARPSFEPRLIYSETMELGPETTKEWRRTT